MKELHELKEKFWKEQELRRQEKEAHQGKIQQGVQHAQTDETEPVQVVNSFDQLAQSRKGEQLQERDFA